MKNKISLGITTNKSNPVLIGAPFDPSLEPTLAMRYRSDWATNVDTDDTYLSIGNAAPRGGFNISTPGANIQRPKRIANLFGSFPGIRFFNNSVPSIGTIADLNSTTGGVSVYLVAQALTNVGNTWGRMVSNWDEVSTEDFNGNSWLILHPNSSGTQLAFNRQLFQYHSPTAHVRSIEFARNDKSKSQPSHFDMFEFMLFDAELDAATKNNVSQYLTDFWEL